MSCNSYKGYQSRLQAERAWVLAHALASVRKIDKRGNILERPTMHIPQATVDALANIPDGHIDTEWYVVTKGRTPGVFPAW